MGIVLLLAALLFTPVSLSQTPPRIMTDAEFTDLKDQSKGKGGTILLVSWSPHMPLSLRALDEAYARSGTSKVEAILDPNANYELALKLATEHGWPPGAVRKSKVAALTKLGFGVHYPSYLFLSKGEVRGFVIPGYKSSKELLRFAREALR